MTEEPVDIPASPEDGWSSGARGQYVPARGRSGLIFRQGEETVDEAYARDAAKREGQPQEDRPRKRRADPKPKATKPKRKQAKSVSDGDLTNMLAQLLSMPAVPAQAVLHCSYCAMHFATQGPATAAELVKLSKEHPALRAALEKWYASWETITYGSILIAYVAKPVLHHAAPEHMLDAVGPLAGVPPRPHPEPEQHEHPQPPPGQPPPRNIRFPGNPRTKPTRPPYATQPSNGAPPPSPVAASEGAKSAPDVSIPDGPIGPAGPENPVPPSAA